MLLVDDYHLVVVGIYEDAVVLGHDVAIAPDIRYALDHFGREVDQLNIARHFSAEGQPAGP